MNVCVFVGVHTRTHTHTHILAYVQLKYMNVQEQCVPLSMVMQSMQNKESLVSP